MTIVIGIDPWSTTVWYAIMQKEKNLKLLDYGIIKTTPKIPLEEKLLEIGNDMKSLIKNFSPELITVEKLFFTKNIKTGIDVAQCRGIIIYESARQNIPILEYTPLELKKAIAGNGKATKRQVQLALKMLLSLKTLPTPDDAADAIGLAYMGILNTKYQQR